MASPSTRTGAQLASSPAPPIQANVQAPVHRGVTPTPPMMPPPVPDHSPVKSAATAAVTLEQLACVPDMGDAIMADIPIIQRVRLRALSRSLLSAVDTSLAAQKHIDRGLDLNTESETCGLALPWLLKKCQSLESLDVDPRWLRGVSGSDVLRAVATHCCRLQRLSIPECRISNAAFLRVAAACRGLRQLNLSRCSDITDASITALARNCPLLEQIDLSYCSRVTDAGFIAIISSCQHLVHLNGANTRMGDSSMDAIAQHRPGMRHLIVDDPDRGWSSGPVTAAGILAVLDACPGLQQLYVNLGRIKSDRKLNQVLRRGRPLASLRLVDARDITDMAFEDLGDGCQGLTQLTLMSGYVPIFGDPIWESVTDRTLASLAGSCRSLTHVEVDVESIAGTDASLTTLALNSPGLRHFSVRRWAVTDAGVKALALHCRLLTSLSMRLCCGVSAEGICELVSLLPELESLDLNGMAVGNDTMFALGAHCNKLVELDVGCTVCNDITSRRGKLTGKINDRGLAAVLQGCLRLRVLTVDSREKITGDAFSTAEVRSGLQLETLDISKCTGFTAKGIVALAAKCNRLRDLELCECPGVTDDSVKAVVLGCKDLQKLSIRDCPVTTEGMMFIISRSPNVLKRLALSTREISYKIAARLKAHGWKGQRHCRYYEEGYVYTR
eukprot:jgi/Mesvir1/29131/Mv18430-RA.1